MTRRGLLARVEAYLRAHRDDRPAVYRRLKLRPKRKPPEAGLPVPAVPPRGPLPLQGGAEAPLEFGD